MLRWFMCATSALLIGACTASPGTGGAPPTQFETPSAVAFASPTVVTEPTVTSPSPSMHPEPAATVAASDPDEVLPALPPFPGIPTLDGHESELEAGCRGTIYYKTRPIPADQCGTRFFGELRAIQALMAVPGQRLVIEAPDGYALSVADAALTTGWMVTIARADALEPTLAIADVGIPKDHGRVVANGIGPDRRVEVRMPLTEGTYIVELDAPLARDGWTFPGSLYFWVVDVG